MNITIVNNMIFYQNSTDNFWGLLTKWDKRDIWELLMKRNQQMSNKGNTVLLK
jgi:hypothetical protein